MSIECHNVNVKFKVTLREQACLRGKRGWQRFVNLYNNKLSYRRETALQGALYTAASPFYLRNLWPHH